MEKISPGLTFGFSLLLTIILFEVYVIWETAFFKWPTLIGLFLLLGINWQLSWGNPFEFIRTSPEVWILGDAISGRLLPGMIPLPGGKVRRFVAFNRGVLTKEARNKITDEMPGGTSTLSGVLANILVAAVDGEKSQWKEVPHEDNMNYNGCMVFVGKLDGSPMRNTLFAKEQAEYHRLQTQLSYMAARANTLDLALTNIANLRMAELQKQLPALKELSDTMKNIKIMPSRGAGGAGGMESIAGDM
jgi:hypothetical protein